MTIYPNESLNAISNMISQVHDKKNHSVMYRQQQNQVGGNQQHQQQQLPAPQMQQQSMQQVQPHAAVAVAATTIDSTQSYWNGHPHRIHRPLFLSQASSFTTQFYNAHENFLPTWSSTYTPTLTQYLQYQIPSPSQPQSPYCQQQLPSQHAQLPHTPPHNLQQHSPPNHLQQHSPQQQQQQQHIHQHALPHQHLQNHSPPYQQHSSPQHYQQHLSPQQHMQQHSSPQHFQQQSPTRSSPEQQHVNGQQIVWNMNNENGGMGVSMPITTTMNGHASSSSSHYTTPTTSPNNLNVSYAGGNMNVPCTADDMNMPSTSGINLPTSCINLPSTSGINIPSTSGMDLPSTSRNNSEINMPCTSRRQACTKTERRSPYGWMKKPSYQSEPKPGKTRTKDKYRVVYSDYQRLELEKEFHTNRYITIKRKNELAYQLQLTDRQVKIWFQNRRAKDRKIRKKQQEQQIREHEQTQLAIVAAAAASGVPIYSAPGGEVMMLSGHLMHVNDNVSSVPPPPPPPPPTQPLPSQPQVPQPPQPSSLPVQYPHHTSSN